MISALFLERLYKSEFLENGLFTLPLFGLKKEYTSSLFWTNVL